MLGVALRNRRFLRLWSAQGISQLGNWLNRMAVIALVAELGEGAHGVAALFAGELSLRLLPPAVFSTLAGSVADRVPRRALMIGADLLQAATVLGLLFVRDTADLPLLYALLATQMSLSIFFHAASSASVPNVVPKEELHEANALSAATWSLMLCVGSLFGGILVNLLGLQAAFLLDAATFLVSAWLVLGLRLPPVPKQDTPFSLKDVVLFTEIRRGYVHVREKGALIELFSKVFWGPAGGFLVLLSLAATERYAAGLEGESAMAAVAFTSGALYSARGVGTGLGPILARRFSGSSESALRRQIAAGFAIAAVFYVGFAFATNLWVGFAFVALAHIGGSALWVASTTFWQRRVDDAFRGRVYALEAFSMTLAFTAGAWLTAGLHTSFSDAYPGDPEAALRWTTWLLCATVAASGALWTWIALRGRRRRRAAGGAGVRASVADRIR